MESLHDFFSLTSVTLFCEEENPDLASLDQAAVLNTELSRVERPVLCSLVLLHGQP